MVSRVYSRQWTARQAQKDGKTRDPLSLSFYYFLPAALSFLDAPGLPSWTRAWGSGRFVSLPWRAPDKAGDEGSDHVLCAKRITIFTSFSQDPQKMPRSARRGRVGSSLQTHTELQKQDSSPTCRTRAHVLGSSPLSAPTSHSLRIYEALTKGQEAHARYGWLVGTRQTGCLPSRSSQV